MAKYYGGVAEGPTFWDYLSYSPDNPLLRPISEAGRVTGVQAVSKKGLAIAGGAGTGFRAGMGYGEQYAITQEQAGEIGYFAGSLFAPSPAKGVIGIKLGQAIIPSATAKGGWWIYRGTEAAAGSKKAAAAAEAAAKGEGIWAKMFGTGAKGALKAEAGAQEAGWYAKMFGKAPKGAEVPKAAKLTQIWPEVGGGAKIGAKAAETGLPWTTYAGKGLKYGAIAGGGISALYLGAQGVKGLGGYIGPGGGLWGGQEIVYKDGGRDGGGDGPTSFWPEIARGIGDMLASIPRGIGGGAEAVGAGAGESIVPLALIGGGLYLVSKERGKKKTRKDKGKKKT